MRYMGKDSIWKSKPLGRFVSMLGAFPVHRGSADRDALKACTDIVNGGSPLVMFPEGTRQSGPVVEELFDGTAYVAAKAGVPIIPMGIGGSEAMMPKGAKLLRPEQAGADRGRSDPAAGAHRAGPHAAQRGERAHRAAPRGAPGPVRRGPGAGRSPQPASVSPPVRLVASDLDGTLLGLDDVVSRTHAARHRGGRRGGDPRRRGHGPEPVDGARR